MYKMTSMDSHDDRRDNRRQVREELSPEFLAVLVLCGGEIRESDRAALAQRDGDAGHPSDDRPRSEHR